MKPTIGRTVHYHPRGSRDQREQAAIIVDLDPAQGFRSQVGSEENETGVFLAVLTRSCMTFPGGVIRFHPDGEPGTWRWPPRVEALPPRQTLRQTDLAGMAGITPGPDRSVADQIERALDSTPGRGGPG